MGKHFIYINKELLGLIIVCSKELAFISLEETLWENQSENVEAILIKFFSVCGHNWEM